VTSWRHAGVLAALLLTPPAPVHTQPTPPAPPTPPARSISTSKQFVIYSKDKNARANVAIRAEDIKEAWLHVLGLRDTGRYPIIFNLDAAPPERMRRPPKFHLAVFVGDAGVLKIQVEIFDRSLLDDPEFDSVILSALLTEFAYRQTPLKAGKAYESPPAWVLEGFYEILRVKRSGIRASVFNRLITSGETPRLANVLRVRSEQLDPASREIFRAQSMALIETLLDLPDGRQGLEAFLGVPRRSPIGPEEILVHFPSVQNDQSSLTRKWLLAMARASASDRTSLLGLRESERELASALDVKVQPDPKAKEPPAAVSGPLALEAVARGPGGRVILTQTRENLLRLEIRAHPLLRPIVEEYRRIVSELYVRPKKRVQDRILQVEDVRGRLLKQTAEMASYLDWVEINKLAATDKEFNQLLEQLSALDEGPRRPDAITRHLDAIEERGW
jgi:hypothetical protein